VEGNVSSHISKKRKAAVLTKLTPDAIDAFTTPIVNKKLNLYSSTTSSPISSSFHKQTLKQPRIECNMDRKLTDSQVLLADQFFARFIYTSGLSFNVLKNPNLKSAFNVLNSTYVQKSQLSDWNIRNKFLDEEFESICFKMENAISKSNNMVLMSDGWSGIQKKHVLNILLHAQGSPWFLENVYTKEASVDGEFQAALFERVINERGGPDKVVALVTDNASVMRKTWRLIRLKFENKVMTYGCAAHVINLLFKDLLSLSFFKSVMKDCYSIQRYFSKHLGSGGLATLHRKQLQLYNKTSMLVKPCITRWGTQYDCVLSIKQQEAAIKAVVSHRSFAEDDKALEVRSVVQRADFWRHCAIFLKYLKPLKAAVMLLQSDKATMSDTYAIAIPS
jgi:Protein of unknown function (DUF 659)